MTINQQNQNQTRVSFNRHKILVVAVFSVILVAALKIRSEFMSYTYTGYVSISPDESSIYNAASNPFTSPSSSMRNKFQRLYARTKVADFWHNLHRNMQKIEGVELPEEKDAPEIRLAIEDDLGIRVAINSKKSTLALSYSSYVIPALAATFSQIERDSLTKSIDFLKNEIKATNIALLKSQLKIIEIQTKSAKDGVSLSQNQFLNQQFFVLKKDLELLQDKLESEKDTNRSLRDGTYSQNPKEYKNPEIDSQISIYKQRLEDHRQAFSAFAKYNAKVANIEREINTSAEYLRNIQTQLLAFSVREKTMDSLYRAHLPNPLTPPAREPGMVTTVAIACVLSIAIVWIVIMIISTFASVVIDSNTLSSIGLRSVGSLPRFRNEQRFPFGLFRKDEKLKDFSFYPSSRLVATNLFGKLNGAGIIAIASDLPGTGKSFITSTLAVATKRMGRRVAILDADVFKQTIFSSATEAPDSTGSIAGLKQRVLWGDTPVYAATDNRESGSEGNYDGIKKSIEHLRMHYDIVFVDLPPVSLVPETSGVYACADLTMLAIRHGMTPVKSVEQMLRNLSIYSDRIIAVINCDPVVREYSKHSYYSRNRPYLQETPKKVG